MRRLHVLRRRLLDHMRVISCALRCRPACGSRESESGANRLPTSAFLPPTLLNLEDEIDTCEIHSRKSHVSRATRQWSKSTKTSPADEEGRIDIHLLDGSCVPILNNHATHRQTSELANIVRSMFLSTWIRLTGCMPVKSCFVPQHALRNRQTISQS